MTPTLLRKVESLVRDGAMVVGPPPRKSPSLSGFPACDADVQRLAAELWSTNRTQGHVLWGKAFRSKLSKSEPTASVPGPDVSTTYAGYDAVVEHLQRAGLPPDFESVGPIRHTHRTADDAEIYFVSNRSEERTEALCRFRVTGRRAELWHPVTGARRLLRVEGQDGGTTIVQLRFEPLESFFVVFPKVDTGGDLVRVPVLPTREVLRMAGPWKVAFDKDWGAPASVTMEVLSDWSQHADPGIRFYSGQATYRTTLQMPADRSVWGGEGELWLDLGEVKNLARVQCNGRDLGVVWCAPWRVEVSQVLQPGANDLEITVANLWPNRLIGDAALPPEQRRTWTTSNPYKAGAPLLSSGLLGPVTLNLSLKSPAPDGGAKP